MLARSAERLIRKLAYDSADIGWAGHAERRMLERDITSDEVFRVLQEGTVREPPGKDEYGSWRCVVRKSIAGRKIQVVVALDASSVKKSVTVVTVYRRER